MDRHPCNGAQENGRCDEPAGNGDKRPAKGAFAGWSRERKGEERKEAECGAGNEPRRAAVSGPFLHPSTLVYDGAVDERGKGWTNFMP